VTSKLIEEAWQSLLDKDDRTSPEEYPEMCLITRGELAEILDAALAEAAAPPQVNGEDAGSEIADAVIRWLRERDLCLAVDHFHDGVTAEDVVEYLDAHETALSGRQTEGAEPVAADGSETGIKP